MKYKHFILFSFILLLFSCKNEEEEFWESICLSPNYHSFVFAFADSQNPISGEIAQRTLLRASDENAIDSLGTSRIHGLMIFPSAVDPLTNDPSQTFKSLYDSNGDNSLTVWPSFFNNMKNYGIDTVAWHQSIKDQIYSAPVVKMGMKTRFKGNLMGIFIKGEFAQSISKEYYLAVYIFKKNQTGTHATLSGTQNTVHKNLLIGVPNQAFGVGIGVGANAGATFQQQFTYDLGDLVADELGIIAVMFEAPGGKPSKVLNSVAI